MDWPETGTRYLTSRGPAGRGPDDGRRVVRQTTGGTRERGPASPFKLALEDVSYAATGADGWVRSIVDNVSLGVRPGQVFTVLGPSGSGKSTLLRAVNRLVEPTGGRILLDGRPTTGLPVQELRRRIGMVFQAPALFDGTVLDNVLYGPRLRSASTRRGGSPAAPDSERELGCCLLRRVGLPPHFCDAPAGTLSGGEAQRVCLARALANEPEVLLLDEPTASLDPTAARHVEELLLRLADETDLTFVFVTHDVRQARRIGDHGLLLVDGRVAERGPLPGFLDEPASELTRRFLEGRLAPEATP